MDIQTLAPEHPSVRRRTSRVAVAGLILSLIPLVFIYGIGILLGAVAWGQVNRRPGELKGKGVAIAAVVIGTIWLLIQAVGLISAVVMPGLANPQLAFHREVKENLSDLARAQASHYKQNKKYAGLHELRWRPRGATRYTYYLGDVIYAPAEGEPQPLDPVIGTVLNDQVFKAAAVANLDQDDKLDVWIIVPDGAPVHVVDDAK